MGFSAYAARRYIVNSYNMLFYVAGIPIMFILGARLFYLFFFSDLNNPAVSFLALKSYGFSLYGGLLGSVFYFAVIAWLGRIPVWDWLDLHTPGLMAYVAAGKTGCFINGCCFGTPTLMPWGITYTDGSQAYNYYIVRALDNLQFQSWQVYSDRLHPVQLYESGLALLLLFFAVTLLRKKNMPGSVFLLITGSYSLLRAGLFYLRASGDIGTWYHLLPWFYIIIAGLSLGTLIIKAIHQKTALSE